VGASALTAWQVLTSLNVDLWLRFSQFPTVADVARAFGDRLGGHDYWTDHTDSLTRILTGFLLAAVQRVATGVLVARSRLAEDLLGPLVEVVRPIPAIALVPVAILLFPSNEQDIVFITCAAAFATLAVTGCPVPLAARAVAAQADAAWQVRSGAATALSAAEAGSPSLHSPRPWKTRPPTSARRRSWLSCGTPRSTRAPAALATATADSDADVRAYASRVL
jgi:hypothetical protein